MKKTTKHSKKDKKNSKVKVFHKKSINDSVDKIIAKLKNAKVDIDKIETFSDLPLSPATLKGLSENDYKVPTEIQRESLIHSLQGLDILGAAKTGSGKTLAFLIPVIEILFRNKWTRLDGVGAVIITPTRELAYQIFETLRRVGFYHDFSAGLIIGGKDLHFEKHRMDRVNIVICTPGRLLQHMDENPLFDCVNMQVLVLDEADRCLDLGFEKTMNSIIENLPPKRQTLLFSATQTKSVKDLARLSLKNPKYVSVHEHARFSTPESLTQSYVVCELHEKMSMLWSFIKNHTRHKILVFMSSCKQVKYTFEIMCKLRPPTALLALYGTLHQERRMKIYTDFSNKQHAVLFATDIAARGLDFPAVNWVVQLDCPEDANTYIHRAGRTARYQKGGESLLVLLPSEKEAMLERLEEKKIPIIEIKINPSKLISPQVKMEAFLARDKNLKESAQRAFVAYFKSVFLMKDKKVFKVNALNPDTYARSLGLVVSPRIRFLQKYNKTQENNAKEEEIQTIFNQHIRAEKMENEHIKSENIENEHIKSEKIENENNFQKSLQQSRNLQRIKETYDFGGDSSEGEDEFLVIKRENHQLEDVSSDQDDKKDLLDQLVRKFKKKPITKAALAKKVIKKQIVANKKVLFSETGEALEDQMKARTTEEGRQYEAAGDGGINIAEAKKVMKAEDKIDRKLFREKIKAKHREKRFREKKLKKKKEEDEVNAYSESEESEPDLSWLPDPDKVYGNQSEPFSEDEQSSPGDNILEERSKNISRKRKNEQETRKKTKRFKPVESYDPLDTGLSLKEDEELVLKFLSNKS